MTFSHHYKPCTFSAGWLIKELKEKIKNSDITEQDIENHLMTIKYLKHLRNNMLVNAVESLFGFLILYMILKGLPLLIAFCATIIVFSIISEFRFYYKNIFNS